MDEHSASEADDNPLLAALRSQNADPGIGGVTRARLTDRYAFGVPDDAALETLAGATPSAGIAELGAGTGYWARLLSRRGVDVVAYDRYPPTTGDGSFAASRQWHTVHVGDEFSVDRHGDRLLLIVWPTVNESWPSEALVRFHRAGGQTFAYAGGGPGSVTGDDRFHRLLGEIEGCVACAYGVTTNPCVCAIAPIWERQVSQPLPSWRGSEDWLRLYRRRTPPMARRRWASSRPIGDAT